MSILQKLRSWATKNITVDRVLALTGIFASITLGILGILASAAQEYFQFAIIITVVLVVMIAAPLIVLLREPRYGTIRLPPYFYKIGLMKFTTDIINPDGSLAVLRHEEETVCMGNALTTIRRYYWGDWDELKLEDLRCLEPEGAKVVDRYKEGYQTMYLISLRHVYNQGDTFQLKVELTVRNGFTNPESEYVEWAISPQVNALVMKVILPPDKVLIPGSAKLRVRVAGSYDEMALPSNAISIDEDGRYEILWQTSRPRQGHNYGIRWAWQDAI